MKESVEVIAHGRALPGRGDERSSEACSCFEAQQPVRIRWQQLEGGHSGGQVERVDATHHAQQS
jgi:hypothetical protein